MSGGARHGYAAVVLAGLVLAAGAGLPGCGKNARPSHKVPKVFVLGIDGFDWNIVDPLVAKGRMPVLAKLLAEGTRADLLTLVPLEKSPVIWTTIATGHLPERQGRGFMIESGPDSARAYTAWNRTTRAFWNILPEHGTTVAVLGWLETWPAERVGGAIVSDYVQYDVSEANRQLHRTYPESLNAAVEPLVVYPKDVGDARLAALLGEPVSPDETDETIVRSLRDLSWILAGDLTFTAIAREFIANRPEDLMAVYLRGPDAVCHQFWGDRENGKKGGEPSRRTRVFGDTVDRYYEETDRSIGQILEKVNLSRTTLFLISDHGFQGGRRALDGSTLSGIWMHRELGTILVVGPGAAGKGMVASGARVVDVLPTLLHLLGLPVGQDMDGEPARWLLSRAGGADRAVRTIPTYETGAKPDIPHDNEPAVDAQIKERVKSLGYVE
jgi:predicted AlkP superfamily phosphohydrolase/phosphomutase